MRSKYNYMLIGTVSLAVVVLLIILYFAFFNNRKPRSNPQQVQQPPQKVPNVESHTTEVKGSDKSTIVLFYANWCGHSKSILPAWEQVKEKLKSEEEYDVIDIEHSSGEVEKHNVQGFPEIRYYPNGFPSDEYLVYKGDRSVESLMKFVYSDGKDS